MHAMTRQMMTEEMTRMSHLVEGEPAKEMEEDHHIRHPASCSTQTGGYH